MRFAYRSSSGGRRGDATESLTSPIPSSNASTPRRPLTSASSGMWAARVQGPGPRTPGPSAEKLVAIHDMLEQAAKEHWIQVREGLMTNACCSANPQEWNEKTACERWAAENYNTIRNQLLALLPGSADKLPPAAHLPLSQEYTATRVDIWTQPHVNVATLGADHTAAPPPVDGGTVTIQHLQAQLASFNATLQEAAQWITGDWGGKPYYTNAATSVWQWDTPAAVASAQSPEFIARGEICRNALQSAVAASGAPVMAPPTSTQPVVIPPPPGTPGYIQPIAPFANNVPYGMVAAVARPLTANQGGAPGKPDLTRMLITDADQFQASLQAFHKLVRDKNLSTHASCSYHVTFARDLAQEADWHMQLGAMGIRFTDGGNGLPIPAGSTMPYAVPGRSNPHMPSFRIVYKMVPERAVTTE